MPETDFEAPDSVPENESATVGTPEGDGEFAPDATLKKLPEGAEQMPRGGGVDEYRQPHREAE